MSFYLDGGQTFFKNLYKMAQITFGEWSKYTQIASFRQNSGTFEYNVQNLNNQNKLGPKLKKAPPLFIWKPRMRCIVSFLIRTTWACYCCCCCCCCFFLYIQSFMILVITLDDLGDHTWWSWWSHLMIWRFLPT